MAKRRFVVRREMFPRLHTTQIHKRFPRSPIAPQQRRYIVNGTWLSYGESIIYEALRSMGIPFEANTWVLGRTAGGAQLDFVIPAPWYVVIEYQGEFHQTSEGEARDRLRNFLRRGLGYRIVYIYERDLPNIRDVLRNTLSGVAMTQAYWR